MSDMTLPMRCDAFLASALGVTMTTRRRDATLVMTMRLSVARRAAHAPPPARPLLYFATPHQNQPVPQRPPYQKLMPSLRFTSVMLSYVLLSLTSAGRRPAGAAFVSAFSSAAPPATPSSLVVRRLGAGPIPYTSRRCAVLVSSTTTKLHYRHDADSDDVADPPMRVNLMTMPLPEMEDLVVAWGFPKFRAKQIQGWIRDKGVLDFDDMNNLPKKLRQTLAEHARLGSLELAVQADSKDGTVKRAYRLHDGQLIESVLMPYDDGRNTACISSQAGCAMGCVFCATGQMGFARQLSSDEIFEQVARFDSELKGRGERLSNIVFMGMGEPLANYRNVIAAIRRMNTELGIGARRITVSTVGVVPSIRKLAEEDLQVGLAVSLHCASEEERDALLPANKRYGGIDELLTAVREYTDKTKRRVTFEWALIEGQNDDPSVARRLGRLLKRHGLRRDLCHVNVIPLNPTGGFPQGSPSGRRSVEGFVKVLVSEFRISATPRMRRGIDIDAGCGQLKATIKKREDKKRAELSTAVEVEMPVAMPEEENCIDDQPPDVVENSMATSVIDIGTADDEIYDAEAANNAFVNKELALVDFMIHEDALDLDESEDEVIDDDFDPEEAERLIDMVQSSFPKPDFPAVAPGIGANADVVKTTKITDEDDVRKATRKRKKLLKNLKAIEKLKDMEKNGKKVLNDEQKAKVAKEQAWIAQVESIEHNLS